jgi:hypothetical protein
MAKRRVPLGGREVMAESVEFETEKENWSTYLLHDGTSLKLKTVLAEILRVDNEYGANGDPIYIINASPVISAVVPDHLKKKAT